MANIPTVTQTFRLRDGEEIQLSLNMMRLYLLKNQRKSVYARLNTILLNGIKDVIFDSITLIYAGYLCANIDRLDQCMSEMDLMERLPDQLDVTFNVAAQLLGTKKAPASETPLPVEVEKEAADEE